MASDESLLNRIAALVAEEHRLQHREPDDAVHEDALAEDRRRLDSVSVELDRCWDLLRQRRARRPAGEDPAGPAVRPPETRRPPRPAPRTPSRTPANSAHPAARGSGPAAEPQRLALGEHRREQVAVL